MQVDCKLLVRRRGADPRSAEFLVHLVPRVSGGGTLERRCVGREGLRRLLEQIGLHPEETEKAIQVLGSVHGHEIAHVLLASERIQAFGAA